MSDRRLHPSAQGFDESAPVYERARPTYPPDAVAWLAERLGIRPGGRVVDLGAGTGKLTGALVASGAELVCVEPLAGMRRQLTLALPEIEVVDGTAEAIPLPPASVDAVTAGQAFHWFDPERALPEVVRVLRPGGGLGLVWNTRDERDPLQQAVTDLLEPLRPGTPRWSTLDPVQVLDRSRLFGAVERADFELRQVLDQDGFAGRFLSVSFVASAPAPERARVEAALRSLVAERNDPIVLPYVTEAFVCFPRDSERGASAISNPPSSS